MSNNRTDYLIDINKILGPKLLKKLRSNSARKKI